MKTKMNRIALILVITFLASLIGVGIMSMMNMSEKIIHLMCTVTMYQFGILMVYALFIYEPKRSRR